MIRQHNSQYNRVEFYKPVVCACGNREMRGRTAKRCIDCEEKAVKRQQSEYYFRRKEREAKANELR